MSINDELGIMNKIKGWMRNIHSAEKGFTLVETILSITILVIIMGSFSLILNGALRSWRSMRSRQELLNIGSYAMNRMIRELRYGTEVVNWDSVNGSLVAFDTRKLLDPDDEAGTDDKIKYEQQDDNLFRSTDINSTGIYVVNLLADHLTATGFLVTLYNIDGSKITDVANIATVVLVQIDLQLTDGLGNTIDLRSAAHLRSKNSE
ncbi:MAG: type II secretion system protein [bacterium]